MLRASRSHRLSRASSAASSTSVAGRSRSIPRSWRRARTRCLSQRSPAMGFQCGWAVVGKTTTASAPPIILDLGHQRRSSQLGGSSAAATLGPMGLAASAGQEATRAEEPAELGPHSVGGRSVTLESPALRKRDPPPRTERAGGSSRLRVGFVAVLLQKPVGSTGRVHAQLCPGRCGNSLRRENTLALGDFCPSETDLATGIGRRKTDHQRGVERPWIPASECPPPRGRPPS